MNAQDTHLYFQREPYELLEALYASSSQSGTTTKLIVDPKTTENSMYLNTWKNELRVHPEDYYWLQTDAFRHFDFPERMMIEDIMRTRERLQ